MSNNTLHNENDRGDMADNGEEGGGEGSGTHDNKHIVDSN